MQTQSIAAIVNFCSNEKRFISNCLTQASKFATQIIVPVCDHFFDGTPEDRFLLEQIYHAHPDCLFVEYPFIPSEIPRRIFQSVAPAHFWHSCSRLIAASFLKETIESVLFLDADEIADGCRLAEWLDASDYHQHTAMRLANYWYFRDPANQALVWEDSPVLAKRRALTTDLLLHQDERNAIYDLLPGPKRRHVTGCDGQPLVHHFSWVRTKDEMLKKIGAWGHKADRDWKSLVELEFSAPFRGTDFVHGYQYRTVAPFAEVGEGPQFMPGKKPPQVIRLSQRELLDLLRFKKSALWRWLAVLIGR